MGSDQRIFNRIFSPLKKPFTQKTSLLYRRTLNTLAMATNSTNSTQQEILLVTGTSFSSRLSYQKEGDTGRLSQKQQLEEACWNGMLGELLPEICHPNPFQRMIVWKIREALSFLELDLGEFPASKDQQLSIDPYCFLATQTYN
jgi:hypothetical protein